MKQQLGAGAEFLFRLTLRARRSLYEKGLFPVTHLPATVVSVGNITVGGTGKTPVVIELARLFREKGHQVALLSRGYGRDDPGSLVHLPPGAEMLDGDHLRYGDEPCLLRSRLPEIPIVLGPDRAKAGSEAIRRYGADLLLLDDGMQHWKLARDREVVVVSAREPYGNGHLLPRGPLREPPAALARADILLLNHNLGERAELDRILRRAGATPKRIRFRYIPTDLLSPEGRRQEPASLCGKRVAAICAIGNPRSFEMTVRSLGAEIVRTFVFRDHHRFGPREKIRIAEQTERQDAVAVTTEKDGFRFTTQDKRAIGLHILRVALQIERGERHLRWLVEGIGERGTA